MCIIIRNQYHTIPICINAVDIILYDDLYVSHYHDPVTHEHYVYQRAVVYFCEQLTCVLLLWPSNTLELRVSAPSIFFPMRTNLHVYTYRDPVTNKYYRFDNHFFPTTTYMCIFIMTLPYAPCYS
jgi:hypothetical protein